MQLHTIVIILLTLAGFALRLRYITSSHPFFDEYTTVLAARQILQQGWPVLPSGLFYEHGLLATYLIAPFTALFINTPPAQWQPAQWGLMLSRWPSLLVSTATIPLIFAVARSAFASPYPPTMAGLVAAGLFAFSPEGMVWGGRARMYALATLLVLLTTVWAYRGTVMPAPAKYRWLALAGLLACLLTQFGAMLLVPPLMIAMLLIGWISWRQDRPKPPSPGLAAPWFWQKSIIFELMGLAAVLALAILVKRLGQPLGTTPLGQSSGVNLLPELVYTIAYQTTLQLSWAGTVTFFARQFGVAHHYWLTIITLAGIGAGIIAWAWQRLRARPATFPFGPFQIYLWLLFGLTIIEMVTLLEPFRRNPRYLVIMLPIFYLIVAGALNAILWLISSHWFPRLRLSGPQTVSAVSLLIVAFIIGYNDLKIALLTPEPAYEEAMAYVAKQRQPGDAVLTMNTPAAALYLAQVDGFTVQNEAGQFLLTTEETAVDRWLGVPWLGSTADFATALNTAPRVWFITDTIRQPLYFKGDWQAMLSSQMEQVWARDNALVYLTRPERRPLPAQPDTLLNITLDEALTLTGVSQAFDPAASVLHLTLFWQPLTDLAGDYTTFVHLRNASGETVAQKDSQPLAGNYPTSQWQPGETVIDPIELSIPADLPAATYTIFSGLYRLDTLERLPVVNDTSGENAIRLGIFKLAP